MAFDRTANTLSIYSIFLATVEGVNYCLIPDRIEAARVTKHVPVRSLRPWVVDEARQEARSCTDMTQPFFTKWRGRQNNKHDVEVPQSSPGTDPRNTGDHLFPPNQSLAVPMICCRQYRKSVNSVETQRCNDAKRNPTNLKLPTIDIVTTTLAKRVATPPPRAL